MVLVCVLVGIWFWLVNLYEVMIVMCENDVNCLICGVFFCIFKVKIRYDLIY